MGSHYGKLTQLIEFTELTKNAVQAYLLEEIFYSQKHPSEKEKSFLVSSALFVIKQMTTLFAARILLILINNK
jgi:hypothetical protein